MLTEINAHANVVSSCRSCQFWNRSDWPYRGAFHGFHHDKRQMELFG
ncbi:hypothetical protein CEV33_1533 [Brucella grignonensis]|uniref:Uncharacterized protein n=1 Tax=Brucella grignonensis TaxID=94627 RepID=A0A256FAR2_9HYPH|nr:hypothetical protein CEV33_1533 [Brucella grignonensis]